MSALQVGRLIGNAAPLRVERWPWAALFIGACVLAAFALNYGLLSAPIELWDESRNAVNALEMQQSGLSLITTYGFRPDLWNTKPPLLIWLMVASMRLFGPSEWAMRLPSALAALGTLAIVVGFSWRLTRSAATALLACILLGGSAAFYGEHGAATADYDALLCFFTTAYICLLFFALHRRRPRPMALVGIGLLIGAAVLTKGVSGLIPGAGIVVYLIATRRWARPFLSPWYMVSALIVMLMVFGFYGIRELEGPGYLSAVAHNELGGRYIKTVGLNRGPWWFYIAVIVERHNSFSAGALTILAPLGLCWATNRIRLGLVYVLSISASLLTVLSLGATKLEWYLTPTLPFLAIGVALAINACIRQAGNTPLTQSLGLMGARRRPLLNNRLRSLVGTYGQTGTTVAVMLMLIAELIHTKVWDHRHPTALPFAARYNTLFENLHRQGIREIIVVDGGVENTEGLVNYAPQLRFYALLWQKKGLTTLDILPDLGAPPRHPLEIIATCDQRYTDALSQLGEEDGSTSGCVAVRLRVAG